MNADLARKSVTLLKLLLVDIKSDCVRRIHTQVTHEQTRCLLQTASDKVQIS